MAKRTLLDLANMLERIPDKIEKEASNVAVRVALTIVNDLVYVTPVDTSQAISNWQVELNSPVDSKISPHFPGLLGSTANASAVAAYQLAKSILETKKPGEKIYISNVLPYINKLNDGSSTQQARGFVQRAVLLGRLQVEKLKVLK